MTYKHTPGPWTKIRLTDKKLGDVVYIVSPDNVLYHIAMIWGTPMSLDSLECDANVRLIITAPAMLAALKALVPYAGMTPPDVVFKNAMAAIAQASA